MKINVTAPKFYDVIQWMFLLDSSILHVIKVKETSEFIYGNFELKCVTMVTNLRCFEKPGPGAASMTMGFDLPKLFTHEVVSLQQ